MKLGILKKSKVIRMDKKKIERINELAKLAKQRELSPEEKDEQYKLRQEYIKAYRENLRQQLHSIKVIDQHGNDVTPKKLKESKRKSNLH